MIQVKLEPGQDVKYQYVYEDLPDLADHRITSGSDESDGEGAAAVRSKRERA